MNKNNGPLTYIHVGTVKTGSTYIQKTFHQNSRIFEQFGVAYPYVFAPALHLPRYANADFLIDRSRDDEARRILRESRFSKVVISEENIFFNISQLNHPAFDDSSNRVILYVRRPADLLLAWAAECAQPYNAFLQNYVSGIGPVSMNSGLSFLADWYETSIRRFMDFAAESSTLDLTVRAFEPASLSEGDLLVDFLQCLGLDAKQVRSHPEFSDPGITNQTRSRKFCDISRAAWLFLGKPTIPFPYEVSLVEEVSGACESGDPRPPIETVTDETIEKISSRFAFFEEFLSEKFLQGAPVFRQRYPDIFGKLREPYRPTDRREVESLTESVVLRREGTKARLAVSR